MDALKDALKNKMKLKGMSKGPDISGDDKESALHDHGQAMSGGKPDAEDNEEVDRAPSVQDDPQHVLEGGAHKDAKLLKLGHAASEGSDAPAGHDNPEEELAMLKKIVSGNTQGRAPMSLGERANDKMKSRMSAIQKLKESRNGDAV